MKIISLLLLFVVTNGATASEIDEFIREGIKFYDIGNYEEAVQNFRLALEIEPSNSFALYELALTYTASQNNEDCIDAATRGLENQTELGMKFTTILGSCYSQLGNTEKAIEVYKDGFLIDPTDPHLHLNIAVTYSKIKKNREAIIHLKEAIRNSKDYATPYYFIAEMYRTGYYTVPAMYFYMQFVLMEPNTRRSKDAAKKIYSLLYQGIDKKENGNMDIIFDPDSPKDEGDFSTLELALSMAAAASITDETKNSKTDIEHRTEALTSFIQICSEIDNSDLVSTFTWQYAVKNMISLQKSADFNTYSYILAEKADLQAAGNWLDKNQVKIEKMTNAINKL